ncbi:MAG TPA: hypothetical protein VI413_02305 [Paludibacter sp.]
MANLISATFTEENEKKAMELLAQLKELFPFGIKLSAIERKRLAGLDDARIPFADKGLFYGGQQPLVVPPFIDLAEYKKDLEFVKATSRVGAELMSFAEMVNDTRVAAGSDAYQAALSIYSSSKAAAKQGVPGTQTIVDEMGKLFDGQRNNAKSGEATAK